MTVRNYSTIPANNNAAPPNGWPEGQAPSTINDCARQMQAEIRESFEEVPYFDWGDTPTRVDNDTFTVATDLTARYVVGKRVKLVGATTGFGRIMASSFGAGVTTIDVLMDSGVVPVTLARVGVMLETAQGFFVTPGNLASNINTVAMTATVPTLQWEEITAAADNKRWSQRAQSERWTFAVLDNAGNAQTICFIDRTGLTIDDIQWFGSAFRFNGVQLATVDFQVNSQSANYTLVLTDDGKTILHPNGAGAGDTFTIPANSSVAFPIGATITFINRDPNNVTIAITTDTLIFAGSTSTGSRTLGQNGVATAIKIEATTWLISGVGII